MNDSVPLFHQASKEKAFTLVEMLVVIMIVAILMAVLFPAWNRGIQGAQEAQCLGNVRTMTSAYLSYVGANGGIFPRALQGAGAVSYATELIPTYLSKELICPLYASGIKNSTRPTRGFRYSVNDNLRMYFTGVSSVPSSPSRTVVVSEMYLLSTGFYSKSHLNDTATGNQQGGVPQTHLDGLNLGFLDGHAELVKNPRDAQGKVEWATPPTYGEDYNSGLYYHQGQFSGMATGRTHW